MAKNQIIRIIYKGTEVGKVGYDENLRKSTFQYHPDFLSAEPFPRLFPYLIRPIKMAQSFSGLEGETFRGLPPMIADSLPDMFGNLVFKEWLAANHKDFRKITPLEQLTYVANRGMGALEYLPAKETISYTSIDLSEITEVAKKVLDLKTETAEKGLNTQALLNIFKMGSSAGGARPKILVAESKKTGMLIPGDITFSDDYNHYLIKLSVDDEPGYPREKIEFVYYQLATSVGIEMMSSKLIDDKHFATLRFDRQYGSKQHILTASGMTGWDYRKPEHSGYENLFDLCLDLGLPHKDVQMLFKRMVFNVVFANYDDHLKNFTFLYHDEQNKWNLAPAYDLTYPLNILLNFHSATRALSINGKRTGITHADLLNMAEEYSIKDAKSIIREIEEATTRFRALCTALEIPSGIIGKIENEFCVG